MIGAELKDELFEEPASLGIPIINCIKPLFVVFRVIRSETLEDVLHRYCHGAVRPL